MTNKPVSKYSGNMYYGGVFSKTCTHVGNTPVIVLADKDRTISGATASRVDMRGKSCIVDMSGSVRNTARLVAQVDNPSDPVTDAAWYALNGLIRQMPTIITLNWPDMTAPFAAGVEFWRQLVRLLPSGESVFCCTGGHGRTGTALAAVFVCVGHYSADDAMDTVRRIYCEDAIETPGQEDYLRQLEEEALLLAEDKNKNITQPYTGSGYRVRDTLLTR